MQKKRLKIALIYISVIALGLYATKVCIPIADSLREDASAFGGEILIVPILLICTGCIRDFIRCVKMSKERF